MAATDFASAEKRKEQRFRISCPVLVVVSTRGRSGAAEPGRLCDIATKGARFQFGRALLVGDGLSVLVHFPDEGKGIITVRFNGVVIRAHQGPPIEIAVRFRRSGQFQRPRLQGATAAQSSSAPKPRRPWIN
jgi:hypothetical protein